MNNQEFQFGDVVYISRYLGKYMQHFRNNALASIIGSYDKLYGGGDTNSYMVKFLDNGCRCAWYESWQLIKIEPTWN